MLLQSQTASSLPGRRPTAAQHHCGFAAGARSGQFSLLGVHLLVNKSKGFILMKPVNDASAVKIWATEYEDGSLLHRNSVVYHIRTKTLMLVDEYGKAKLK